MAWDGALEPTREPHPLGDVLQPLLDAIAPGVSEPFISKNTDVQYLGAKSGLPPRFIRQMVGWFKEPIVLEALRRFEKGWTTAVFVGICRNVEKNYAQEAQG